jgi:hypothetical protein
MAASMFFSPTPVRDCQTITDMTSRPFDKVRRNRGVWLGLKSTIPALMKRGGGSIVITSSTQVFALRRAFVLRR